ncbi:IS66-like element accessory protein TnpA [Pararobbsia alpina]|uniref:IS66-like element accessory protein TnpA n=1 Tax=Pararobbsia alpina TaxID=621374 RepID=UPI001FE2C164|nr:transposase [Pararobbsia alpina]
MNTIEEQVLVGRRRRRQYSEAFKAQAVADCQGPGVSIAAIALHHQLNANLLRRWVEQAEGKKSGRSSSSPVCVQSTRSPAFVPVSLEANTARPSQSGEIRVEVRRAEQVITISWPVTDAAACGNWLRELLR